MKDNTLDVNYNLFNELVKIYLKRFAPIFDNDNLIKYNKTKGIIYYLDF